MSVWSLIHDASSAVDSFALPDQSVRYYSVTELHREAPDQGAQVLTFLGDEAFKALLPLALEKNWELKPLPHPDGPLCISRFGLPRDLAKALAETAKTEVVSVGLLTCNGLPVLSSVVAGEALTLNVHETGSSQWSVFKGLIKGVFRLRPFRFSVTTAKNQGAATAGIGLIVLSGPEHPYLGKNLRQLIAYDSTRGVLLILAPRSAVEYASLLVRLVLLRSVGLQSLPRAVGLVRSRVTTIASDSGIDFAIDGVPMSARELELLVSENPLRMRLPPLSEACVRRPAEKDSVRIDRLPKGESVRWLDGSRLPLFNHASEDDFRELFSALKTTATFSRSFLVLMVLSALLALFGLYANSAPVIIGAMILAPLMGPIISLSMGLARSHPMLIRASLKTLILGVGAVLLCAMVVSALMPLRSLTDEMRVRLSPNLLDLGIAVVSGIAGAYANAKEEIAKSLAGVAIAVALAPPLCVLGIGLGWTDWTMVFGAALLFATNLVGIAVSGSLTFLALGFAPLNTARAGLALSFSLMAIVSIPLYLAFDEAIEKNRIMERLAALHTPLADDSLQIVPLSVQPGEPTLVRLQVIAREPITGDDLEEIRDIVGRSLNRPIALEATIVLRR